MSTQKLGKLLQARRKQLHLSQAYVAELACLSVRQLLDWEAGRGNLGFVQLGAVLNVLGMQLQVDLKRLA